jgi:uncharacterized protein YegL
MADAIVRMVGGKPVITDRNGRTISLKKKGIIYLLIDVSESMMAFVGPRDWLKNVPLTRQAGRDGASVNIVPWEHIGNHKTKLQVALAGVAAFSDTALKTKVVGIAAFASAARICQQPTHDREKLADSLSSMESHPLNGGGTNMADALRLLLQPGLSPIETVIVVTDGMPQDREGALLYGKMLKDGGTEILVISTEDADRNFLGGLASRQDLSIHATDENLGQAITDCARLLRA